MDFEKMQEAIERLTNPPEEFDEFASFRPLPLAPFEFQPAQFEIFQEGGSVKKGACHGKIVGKLVHNAALGKNLLEVQSHDIGLGDFVNPSCQFGTLTTQHDRLLFLNIPHSEAQDGNALGMLRMLVSLTIGSAGIQRMLYEKQPYACSLFNKNKKLVRVSFSVNVPESLIEFNL